MHDERRPTSESDRPQQKLLSLLKEAVRDRSILLPLAAVLCSVLLIIYKDKTGSAEVALAIATGLIATAIFFLMQYLIFQPASDRLIKESIASGFSGEAFTQSVLDALSSASSRFWMPPEELKNELRQTVDEVRVSDELFYPTNRWSSSTGPNKDFNDQLEQDLRSAAIFLFCGASARSTAERVRRNNGHVRGLQLDVVLPNIQNHDTVALQTRYYREMDVSDPTELHTRKRVMEGIWKVICISHLCRSVSICLTDLPVLNRFEIFSGALYFEHYSAPNDDNPFPPSYRFSSQSVFFDAYSQELRELVAESPRKHVIPKTTDLDARCALFREIVGEQPLSNYTLENTGEVVWG